MFRSALRQSESGGNIRADRTNKDGRRYVGDLQIGQARLDDYNRATGSAFTLDKLKASSAKTQAKVGDWHMQDIDNFISKEGLGKYEGSRIKGQVIDRNSMQAVAHLGGKGGLKKYLQTGGQYNPADELGTSLQDYASKFGPSEVPGAPLLADATMSSKNSALVGAGAEESNMERSGLFGKYTPTSDEGDMLLAIGSGLLAGDDWSSGLGSASQNLLGVSQGHELRDQAQQRTDNQHNQALAQLELKNRPKEPTYEQAANMRLPDGTVLGDVVFSPTGGRGTLDENGQFVPTPPGAERVPMSTSAGTKSSMTPSFAKKSRDEIRDAGEALNSYDRIISNMQRKVDGQQSSGISQAWETMKSIYQIATEQGISPDAIANEMTKGEIQGIMGKARVDIAGPGVLTEQDVRRMIQAFGGDASWMSSPEVMLHMITQWRDKTEVRYDEQLSEYNDNVLDHPQSSYNTLERTYTGAWRNGNNPNNPEQSRPTGDGGSTNKQKSIDDILTEARGSKPKNCQRRSKTTSFAGEKVHQLAGFDRSKTTPFSGIWVCP